jgi:hypothetical protein
MDDSIDPYAELFHRADAEQRREVLEIERAAALFARRVGLSYRRNPVKFGWFVAGASRPTGS